MSAEPGRAPAPRSQTLRLVDTDSGESIPFLDKEVAGLQAELQVLRDQLKGAERDVNTWRARYFDLKRDKEAEARENAHWPEALRLFQFYCRMTPNKKGEPRKLGWNAERFWLVEPFLKKHGVAMCERAVIGRVFDHYVAKRKNGSEKHFHEWERIFKSTAEFEESCNRAPLDFMSELAPDG